MNIRSLEDFIIKVLVVFVVVEVVLLIVVD